MTTIVATSRARARGICQCCGRRVNPGEVVHKVDVGIRGETTDEHNGRAQWWCESCASEIVPAAAGASEPDVESLPTSS
jgi:hypothetical protein